MKEFAGQRELSVNCLSYWSSTLKREPRRATPRLLPVRVSAHAEAATPGLELVVGPLRLRFEGGSSPTYIAAVARAVLTADRV